MKKPLIALAALVLIFAGVVVWGLSGASNANAPKDVKTIDVSPQP